MPKKPKGKKWGSRPPTHNWVDLRTRFMSREWATLGEMARETGLSVSTLSKKAADEKWHQKRATMAQHAEADAIAKVRLEMTREMVRRFKEQLKDADFMRSLGIEVLTKLVKQNGVTGDVALRAITSAHAVEKELLFRPKQAPNEPKDPDDPSQAALPIDGGADEEGQQGGIVVIPGTLTVEQWESRAQAEAKK